MSLDPSQFLRLNVTDSCAIQNILSSKTLFSAANTANCYFCCTRYVHYEYLHKRRSKMADEDKELQKRLRDANKQAQFKPYHLEVEDLQDVKIMEKRRNLGMGELSSIAYAKKTQQAFLTDDQTARKLAEQIIGVQSVQTTPHLFGWLFFEGFLLDNDKDAIISEHEKYEKRQPLSSYFEIMYTRALKYKSLSRQTDG